MTKQNKISTQGDLLPEVDLQSNFQVIYYEYTLRRRQDSKKVFRKEKDPDEGVF